MSMSGHVSAYNIFCDWVEMSALSIQNACFMNHNELWLKREERYKAIISNYSLEEQRKFTEMFGLLSESFDDNIEDLLGEIYMRSESGNKFTGQFFTPFHISVVTAELGISKDYDGSDVLTFSEPSCGSGKMIIASAAVLKSRGFDYKKKMKELGMVHYTIAADSSLVTKNWISELSLVLRGEDILETQSFDLEKDNVYVMAYVTPKRAKYLNRGFKATIIVNDDVEYTATVVSMGARTEEIPEAYRNNLSKDHIAAIAVLRIDDKQEIPFWSLVNGMPVIIRFDNRDYKEVSPEEYLQLTTPRGLKIPEAVKNHLYNKKR